MTLTTAITLNAILAAIVAYSVVALLARAIFDDRTPRERQRFEQNAVVERDRLAA